MSDYDFRAGKWEEALSDVERVDFVCSDPPYSEKTHDGHNSRRDADSGDKGRDLSYLHWSPDDVHAFVSAWAPRCAGWFACMSDHLLVPAYAEAYRAAGLTVFAPVPCVIPGMTVRLAGDGPSSWAIYLNVARPKSLSTWGTLPGAYTVPRGERVHIGGKPLGLMQAIVRDYSKPGDLVCDPCAGAGTTLLAALNEGRRAIGSEVDPQTYEIANRRLTDGFTPPLFSDAAWK
jgi:hypothetical protein